MEQKSPKEKFFTLYANLPINLRSEIIAVIDNEPISWKVAYREISASTKLGDRLLEWLLKMQFI